MKKEKKEIKNKINKRSAPIRHRTSPKPVFGGFGRNAARVRFLFLTLIHAFARSGIPGDPSVYHM